MNSVKGELDAIRTVHDALEQLDDQARRRVLSYIGNLFHVDMQPASKRMETTQRENHVQPETEDDATGAELPNSFPNFAAFFAKAKPKTQGEKALVAGYWLQVCGGADNFLGATANKELKHLGHQISNITDAINTMKARNPALILQVQKRGKGRQARKLYQISFEGEQYVKGMVGG